MIREHLELNFRKFKVRNTGKKNENFELFFFPLSTKELNPKKSGIHDIYELISKVYQTVSNNVCTTLKHKIVFETIESMSLKLQKEENNKDSYLPFIKTSALTEELQSFEHQEEVKEAIENIEDILFDLNNLGVIIFDKNSHLKDTIIVEPQWFNKVFSIIIEDGKRRMHKVLSKTLQNLLIFEKQGVFLQQTERNCKIVLEELIDNIKGEADHKYKLEEIWSNPQQKQLSNIDKISLDEISEKIYHLQIQMREEGVYHAFDFMKLQSNQNILQSFYTVNEEVTASLITVKKKFQRKKKFF